jgi:hypothetical protein
MTENVDQQDKVLSRLTDLLDRIAPQNNVILDPGQKRLVMTFRAMRNGLGNFGGRHGQPTDNALMTPPIVSRTGSGYGNPSSGTPAGSGYSYSPGGQAALTFFEPPLPGDTQTITLHYPPTSTNSPTVVTYGIDDVDAEYWDLAIARSDVLLVEATGAGGTPLVVGRPINAPPPQRQLHSTTVTGKTRPAQQLNGG